MKNKLTPAEFLLLSAFLAMFAAAALAAPVRDLAATAHDLADARTAFGLLRGWGVVSTAAFALVAAAGLGLLWRAPRRGFGNMQRAMSHLFFSGLGLTALGAATYQLDPGDATLAVQRYCAAFVFAGALGLVAAGRVGESAAGAVGMATLAGGLAAARVFADTGNVLPWTILQFGGVALLWFLAFLPPTLRALPVNWPLVLVAGGAARLLEINDHAVFELTGHMVSGVALMHVVGALAACPVIAGIARAAQERR